MVNPGGSRLWYLKYRIDGKEPRLGLGAYLDVSLAYARHQRAAEKAARSPEKSFMTVALSWHKSNKTWSDNHADRLRGLSPDRLIPLQNRAPVFTAQIRNENRQAVPRQGAVYRPPPQRNV